MITWVRKPPRGEDLGAPPPPELGGSTVWQFVRGLAKRGADVNAQLTTGRGGLGSNSTKGATPFLMASATADIPYMKLCSSWARTRRMTNVDGCTPLIVACGISCGLDQAPRWRARNGVLEAAKLLWKLGADVNTVDANGERRCTARA